MREYANGLADKKDLYDHDRQVKIIFVACTVEVTSHSKYSLLIRCVLHIFK